MVCSPTNEYVLIKKDTCWALTVVKGGRKKKKKKKEQSLSLVNVSLKKKKRMSKLII